MVLARLAGDMRAEYLLFDLFVLLGPLVLGARLGLGFDRHLRAAVVATVIAAVPWIVWDAVVTGAHWTFDPRYVLGVQLFGLPIEELLFFLAVPLACLFTFEVLLGAAAVRPSAPPWVYLVAAATIPLGIGVYSSGLEYTGLVLVAFGSVAVLDRALRTELLRSVQGARLLGAVAGFTLVFDLYLTWRPVVHYEPSVQLGIHVLTIPIEDFVYGVALVYAAAVFYQRAEGRVFGRPWAAWLVERRLGGFRHVLGTVDRSRPARVQRATSAAVVGGGLAGLVTAMRLAERGVAVTLFERDAHLGGKVAGWRDTASDGEAVDVEHGFHAFFRHYYNLNAFLADTGVAARMRPIDDYVILARDGRSFGFAGVEPTPVLNLLALARAGLYSLREVAFGPAGRRMEAFLRYDPRRTVEALDGESFAEFARSAELPAGLRLVFHTFARAFFASADRLSMAELVKSFHFYYLSHDHGLVYDHLDGSYAADFVGPIAARLLALGVDVRLARGVSRIDRDAEGLAIGAERFDHVVLAADVAAAREIVAASPAVRAADPDLAARMERMHAGQRYAVLRLWIRGDAPLDLPVFVATERTRVLDSVTFVHRVKGPAQAWAIAEGGSVLELHCYALPDDLLEGRDIEAAFVAELGNLRPTFAGLGERIVRSHLQVRSDFTAFHVGMAAHRPGVTTRVPGLVLAGDWVSLPTPAMLMEAACTSGVLAANAVLEAEGVQGHEVWTVPQRGLLAGLPERPASVSPGERKLQHEDAPRAG
jgi:isorenieratene synthase